MAKKAKNVKLHKWTERTGKRAKARIETKEAKREVIELKVEPIGRALQPDVMPEPRLCKHCQRWNPKVWTDPKICVHCFHYLDGSERKEGV